MINFQFTEYIKDKKSEKGIALMTHAVVGYPDNERWRDLALACIRGGADVLELQLPFSDPLADGSTIREANQVALQSVLSMEDMIEDISSLVQEVDVPVILMSYFNPIFRFGTQAFIDGVRNAGVQALIVPDMNIDEENFEYFWTITMDRGLDAIQIVTPQTSTKRMKIISQYASGFVYCVARMGVTGVREQNIKIDGYLNTIGEFFDLPLAVGFGISKKEDIERIYENADMAIVGSAIIDTWKKDKSIVFVHRFVKELREQID